jgi:hypothetical protein
MSSLQAAFTSSGDILNGSPLRYPRPLRTITHPRSTNEVPRNCPTSTAFGSYHPQTDHRDAVNSSPSAFSSLHRAASQAGILVSNKITTIPSNQLPIHSNSQREGVMRHSQQYPSNHALHTKRNVGVVGQNECDLHCYDTLNFITGNYDENVNDEHGLSWDPPIREAILSSSHPLPSFSPLTIHSNRTSPTSLIQDDMGLLETPGHLVNVPSSYTCNQTVSTYAFVPIREGEVEIDEKPRFHENFTSISTDPTVKLSSTSKCWEPQASKVRYNNGEFEDDYEDIEYYIPLYNRSETPNTHLPSNMTPTKGASSDGMKKCNNRYGGVMAPSPTFTIETAEMTIDTPSVVESRFSVDTNSTYSSKACSLVFAMGTPPIYSPIPQSTSSSLRRNVSFTSDVGPKNIYQSSLAIAASTGQSQDYQQIISARPNLNNVHFYNYNENPMEYSQQYYCYQVNQHDPSTSTRPHSAPTLGRPSFNALSKNDDDCQQRKCRVKTELCMHYENGRPCPFGASKSFTVQCFSDMER